MTLAMRFARRGGQAGTDMTAVQSARDLGEILTSSLITVLAAQLGYAGGRLRPAGGRGDAAICVARAAAGPGLSRAAGGRGAGGRRRGGQGAIRRGQGTLVRRFAPSL